MIGKMLLILGVSIVVVILFTGIFYISTDAKVERILMDASYIQGQIDMDTCLDKYPDAVSDCMRVKHLEFMIEISK